METERKLLSTGELRVIEALGKHGSINSMQIGSLIKPTPIFRCGKNKFNLLVGLKDKGLIVETEPKTSSVLDNEKYDLTDKGRQVYRLVNRIDRARKKLRKVLEEE